MAPILLGNAIPSVLNKWHEMPLSALLCLFDLCFLTTRPPVMRVTTPMTPVMRVTSPIFRMNASVTSTLGSTMVTIPTDEAGSDGGLDVRFGPGIGTRFGAENDTKEGITTTTTTTIEPMLPTRFSVVDFSKKTSMVDRLDALDIDALLKNTRLMNIYLRCVLETGPCTAEGRELKREIIEVLHTGCSSCSERTKTRLKKSFLRLKSDPVFRESYKKVLDKYDPDKRYIENLERFLQ